MSLYQGIPVRYAAPPVDLAGRAQKLSWQLGISVADAMAALLLVQAGKAQSITQALQLSKRRYSIFEGRPVRYSGLYSGIPVRYAKDAGGHGSEKKGESKEPTPWFPKRAAREAAPKDTGNFSETINSLVESAPETRTSETSRGARFGSKVFISHLFDAYKAKHPGTTREDFNRQLLEAHHKGEVELSRADLVEAMHPADVKESEVKHPGGFGEFHFARKKEPKKNQQPAAPERYSLYEGKPVR